MCTTSCFNGLKFLREIPLFITDYGTSFFFGWVKILPLLSIHSFQKTLLMHLKRLLVECMVELLPVITLIINLSLHSGYFPEV